MRLLRTDTIQFEEFYDEHTPAFAILSHRWNSPEQEVSYSDFKAGRKQDTIGYAKILGLCTQARQCSLKYCWIDTCCIDKDSSSELTEAINTMFRWYERAIVCFAYLADTPERQLADSDWFRRGWTLQELLAPKDVVFFDNRWQSLGTKSSLAIDIARATGIDIDLLSGNKNLAEYSVAQKMSWASKRSTSRREDEAYCLLGVFDVNMPLLYGEGSRAFRRLQEQILTSGEDTSIFAWSECEPGKTRHTRYDSLLAPSPSSFTWCSNIHRGFATQRILFEVTNRGMMILIHQTYDPATLKSLLMLSRDMRRLDANNPLGLTIPLGCYRIVQKKLRLYETIFLNLILDGGKWCRIGVSSYHDPETTIRFTGAHYAAYKNDYVRIYVYHDLHTTNDEAVEAEDDFEGKTIRFLHLRDKYN